MSTATLGRGTAASAWPLASPAAGRHIVLPGQTPEGGHVLSVLLNILFAKEAATWTPDKATREGSALYSPIRAFAPMIVPALGKTKWVRKAVDRVQEEMRTAAED